MRFFSFFMALLILVLSCLPCADVHKDDAGISRESRISVSHKHSTQGHKDPELCSPFCHCSCCGVTYTILNTGLDLPLRLLLQSGVRYSEYAPAAVVKRALPVWQPPRLA